MTPQEALNESMAFYGLPNKAFDAKWRGPYQEARYFVWWRMINVHGCSPMDCQRETGFNHTTVTYGVRKILRRHPDPSTARPVILDRAYIIDRLTFTLEELGVSVETVNTRSRRSREVDERGAVWWYMHRVCGIPQQTMARMILGRAHSAVRTPIATFEKNDGPRRWGIAGLAVEADQDAARGGGPAGRGPQVGLQIGACCVAEAPGTATCHPGRTRVA
jgi:hypothetical protein